jgi:hypothetical protein
MIASGTTCVIVRHSSKQGIKTEGLTCYSSNNNEDEDSHRCIAAPWLL